MKYERGDIVWGIDPFKPGESGRPWLLISGDAHPFHGDQYVGLALTTRTWHDHLLPLDADDWIQGGTPEPSSVIPWSVNTVDHDDVEAWHGRIAAATVDGTVDAFVGILRDD